MKLRKRPQKPEGRKKLAEYKIKLFPDPKRLYYKRQGDGYVACSKEETDNPNNFDLEEVPSPTLQEIINYFNNNKIPLNEVLVNYNNKDYKYGEAYYADVYFTYIKMENEEDYQNRINKYKKELKEYQIWYKENRGAIKVEKDRLKKIKDEEKRKRSEKAKLERLKKKKEKIEKELNNMKDKL